jgi:carboxyl-terminal processing protease
LACLLAFADLRAQLSSNSRAIMVKRMIELNHLSPRAVDDSFSSNLFKKVISAADSRRLLFTDAEYKSLMAYRLTLDDELQAKSWAFVDLLVSLYNKALLRADSIVTKHLQKPFDFNVSESVSRSNDETFEFAKDVNALSSRWARYLKFVALDQLYDMAEADTTGKTTLKATIASSETKVRERIRAGEKKALKRPSDFPDGVKGYVMDMYLNAVATGFDPHTNYFSQQKKDAFKNSLSTETVAFGIGLEEDEEGNVVIERLVPGGPAWKSGDLNKGDKLLSLQWEGKEAVEMTGATLEEAYAILDQSSTDRIVMKFEKADGTVAVVLLRKEVISNEENVV